MGRNFEQKKAQALYKKEKYATDPEYRATKLKRGKQYYLDNKEKLLEKASEYYENINKEELLEKRRIYYTENKERILSLSAKRTRDRKIKAILILGNRCSRCGWNEHPAALEFHHRDPSAKLFNVCMALAQSKKISWEEIVEEALKCDLLCANCHAIVGSTWILEESWPINETTNPIQENIGWEDTDLGDSN